MVDSNNELDMTVVLEEYKELRQEIRTYLSRRQQSKNFAYLISLGVIGLDSSKLGFGYLVFWVAAILILFIWYDELGRLRAIFRVAAYIQLFIETQVRDLHWETLGVRHSVNRSWVGRVVSNAEFPLLITTHAILGATRLWPTCWMASIAGAIILLFGIGVISFKCIDLSRYGRKAEVESWKALLIEYQTSKKSS